MANLQRAAVKAPDDFRRLPDSWLVFGKAVVHHPSQTAAHFKQLMMEFLTSVYICTLGMTVMISCSNEV